jgi:DNA polymerase-3 subunit epsilon
MRQIFLDTETTGLDAATGDRLVEIGCIEMVDRRLTGSTLHLYVNPGRPSSPEAERIHGLTEEFLADKPPFEAVADELLAYLQGAELIIHNADFDVGFLRAELARAGRSPLEEVVSRVHDSIKLARDLYPGKGVSLDALCRRLEVDNTHRTYHGALVDAALLAEVYLRMTRGQDSLVIDMSDDSAGGGSSGPRIDLSGLVLAVLEPTPEELEAHERLLADLDKASGGKTVWRELMA